MLRKALFSFLLIVILTNSHVKSLITEGIRGGYTPEAGTFKYQATLNVKLRRNRPESIPECACVLIDKRHALTIAHCLIKQSPQSPNGIILLRWYRISMGTHDLKSGNALLIDIDEIYVHPDFNPVTHEADIAVAKLHYEIHFPSYTQLLPIDLPDENTVDHGIIPAIVSGHGFHEFNIIDNTGSCNYELKYLHANVTTIEECKSISPYPSDNQLCVKSLTDERGQQWGICKGDAGAPLVYNGKLIGLANKYRYDCVDTIIPTSYTRVKPYVGFIQSIIAGTPPPRVRVLREMYLELIPTRTAS